MSLALGIVGVVLTIVFFFVGYRQTIGARKERAAAANRDVSSTLLRRLTLEKSFVLTREGINKLLAGAAIESRVRLSDMLDPDQLETVLFAKIVEHDFIDEAGRDEALKRLENSFKSPETQSARIALVENVSEQDRTRRNIDAPAILGLLAAMLALATSAGLAIALEFRDASQKSPGVFPSGTLLLLMGLVAATALVLTFFVRFREENRTPIDVPPSPMRAEALERAFSFLAKKANPTFKDAEDRWIDYSFDQGDKKIGVEFKFDLNRYGLPRARSLIKMLEDRAKRADLSHVMLVTGVAPQPKYKELGTSLVSVHSTSEALSTLRGDKIGG